MERLNQVYRALSELKASDIIVIDVSSKLPLTNYFVIATGTSSTHINALADRARDALGEDFKYLEGTSESTWILVDGKDIIVHLFTPEDRNRYQLERLFAQATHIDFANT